MKTDDEQLNIYDDVEEAEKDELDVHEAAESETTVVKKHSKAEIAINVALWLAIIVLAILVVLRLFVYNSVMVDGLSMSPTYEHGDVVVVNKAKTPSRGDVVVFYLRDVDNKLKAMFASDEQCREGQPYEKLIKRVVATAGDKIWVRRVANGENGSERYEVVVDTVDGNRLTENFYVKKGETLPNDVYYIYPNAPSGLGILENCTESNPYVVSKGCFFAMGDHRINSMDSRAFGEFPLTRMFGVVLDK